MEGTHPLPRELLRIIASFSDVLGKLAITRLSHRSRDPLILRDVLESHGRRIDESTYVLPSLLAQVRDAVFLDAKSTIIRGQISIRGRVSTQEFISLVDLAKDRPSFSVEVQGKATTEQFEHMFATCMLVVGRSLLIYIPHHKCLEFKYHGDTSTYEEPKRLMLQEINKGLVICTEMSIHLRNGRPMERSFLCIDRNVVWSA